MKRMLNEISGNSHMPYSMWVFRKIKPCAVAGKRVMTLKWLSHPTTVSSPPLNQPQVANQQNLKKNQDILRVVSAGV